MFILACCGEQNYEKRDLSGKRIAAALSGCRADAKISLVFTVFDLAGWCKTVELRVPGGPEVPAAVRGRPCGIVSHKTGIFAFVC